MINFKISRIFLVLILIFTSKNLYSQEDKGLAIGDWKIHRPANKGKLVEIADNSVYCATQNSLFYYDKNFNTINTLSKVDGLSGINVTAMDYSKKFKTLVLGYEDGNIDLIINNKSILNIDAIVRSSSVDASFKKINEINIKEDKAFISGNFGLAILNIKQKIISESFLNIGKNGSAIKVYSSAILGDSLFISSSEGLKVGNMAKNNLLNFKNWSKINIHDSLRNTLSENIAAIDNKLVFAVDTIGLFLYEKDSIIKAGQTGRYFHNLSRTNNTIIAQLDDHQFTYQPKPDTFAFSRSTHNGNFIICGIDVSIDEKDGGAWFADRCRGLVNIRNGRPRVFFPNGPSSKNIFKFYFHDKTIYGLAGGYKKRANCGQAGLSDGFYFRNNENWKISGRGFRDLVDMVYSSAENKYYFGSQGNGLISWDKNSNNFKVINNENLPKGIEFKDYFGSQNAFHIRIPAVEYERSTGKIWFTHFNDKSVNLKPPIYSKNSNGEYEKFTFPYSDLSSPLKLLVDSYGNKWISFCKSKGGKILVFNDKTGQHRKLSENKSEGDLTDNIINDMVEDKKGEIWLATDNGVSVIYNPSQIYQTSTKASFPIIDQRPLLFEQVVNSITVDGGNRKWVATNNGVFLFSPDGDEQIKHFTSDNSPLLSDNVIDVGINHKTSEVFFGTDKGIISYRGTSTEGKEEKPERIKIFPNPAKRSFTGQIGITGLANNALVKITDINGKLVYETRANGGMATWNMTTNNHNKVSSGVYIVLTSQDNGKNTVAGKIVISD